MVDADAGSDVEVAAVVGVNAAATAERGVGNASMVGWLRKVQPITPASTTISSRVINQAVTRISPFCTWVLLL